MEFVRVAEDEQDQEPIELPIEQDGTILLSTVSAQYPGACGLKYRSERGTWRGLRLVDGRLQFPGDTWQDVLYIVVFPKGASSENKRKGEESAGNPAGKTRKLEMKKNQDLVVLGLPWKTTEDELKAYFEQFGEVVFSELRTKHHALSARVSKLECLAGRRGWPWDGDPAATPAASTSGLNRERLETSLDALSHCTQQLHQQVEVLKSHKRQQDRLPPCEVTSLELSLSLLERCLQHLGAQIEDTPPPQGGMPCQIHHQPPRHAPSQPPSDVRQAFNVGAGIDCLVPRDHRRRDGPSHQPSSSLDAFMQHPLLEEGGMPMDTSGGLRGSRPCTSMVSVEIPGHQSSSAHGTDSNVDYEEDQSWLEYDSSCDANATMAAKIRTLVGNQKWSRLQCHKGATELTRSLAHILYTKEELILSTITGRNGFEALDNVKLMAIREAVEKKYGHVSGDFELLWKQCVISLGQHCKYLRQKSSSQSQHPMMCRSRQESPEQKPTLEKLQRTVIKYYRDTGKSKGFGFVRFADSEVGKQVVAKKHMIQGRACEVKVPDSRPEQRKLFVRNLTKDMTESDLREYFSEFCEVTEVYLPNPHRGFAFVTFEDGDIAQNLKGQTHIIKGHQVQLNDAEPRGKNQQNRQQWDDQGWGAGGDQGYSGGYQNNYGGRGGGFGDNKRGGRQGGFGSGGGGGNRQDLNSQLPMALAAALNQAGWGMLLQGGMGQGTTGGHQGGGAQNPSGQGGANQGGGQQASQDGLGGGYGMSWSQGAQQGGQQTDNSGYFGNQKTGW